MLTRRPIISYKSPFGSGWQSSSGGPQLCSCKDACGAGLNFDAKSGQSRDVPNIRRTTGWHSVHKVKLFSLYNNINRARQDVAHKGHIYLSEVTDCPQKANSFQGTLSELNIYSQPQFLSQFLDILINDDIFRHVWAFTVNSFIDPRMNVGPATWFR